MLNNINCLFLKGLLYLLNALKLSNVIYGALFPFPLIMVMGYIVLNINIRELFISRNVVFYENVFPYKNHQNNKEINNKEEEIIAFLNDFYAATTLWMLKY